VKPLDSRASTRSLRGSGTIVVALLLSSCGAPLMKLPMGPGAPAADAADVVAQATATCRGINAITLEISVHGTAGGHRLRGRLTAGLAKPASARLEANAPFGQPIFIFVANAADASLLLPRDRRVLEHGKPADVLEAVSGVPLDAPSLRTLITGCANAPDASDAVAFGNTWRVAPDGADSVYFRHDAAWHLVATVRRDAWRAEYSMFENNLPRAIHIVSQPAGRFDLQMDLSQVEINVPIGQEAFRLDRTAGAEPISLDELRQSGPLGDPSTRVR
jgi:hypothetical protein